ncbi:DUF3099 domain-containing protein [Agromyces bauzanensis]
MRSAARPSATTMKQHQSITSLPPSPEAERRARMIKYTVAMSIRVACIFALLFAKGWWLAVFAAGAIFLPYVAVVLANVSGPSRDTEVLRPGSIVPVTPPAPGGDGGADTADEPRQPDDERGAA